ncbi:MAG: YgjV family protein [Ruminococcus sp.]|nr:YgjV family protein [Ruminococcus sp.]
MKFIIAQILGILVGVASLSCVQFKNEKIVLAGQFLSNVFMAGSCALLGGLAGAWICVLAAIQTLLVYLANNADAEKAEKRKRVISVVFGLAYVAGTFITYQRLADLAVCACALLFTLTIVQKDSGKMRTIIIFNQTFWLFYDVTIGAYTNIITHGLTLISTVTAKLRLDKKKI